MSDDQTSSDPATDPAEDPQPTTTTEPAPEPAPGRRTRRPQVDVAQIRTTIARVVGAIALLFALVMALAALFIAVKANQDNGFVSFVLDFAKAIDLGIFSLDNPIKDFSGSNADIKTALLNYGLGAIFYLVIGRILDRIIRP